MSGLVFVCFSSQAQTKWYRVDDPESKFCFFIDSAGNESNIGKHLKILIADSFSNGLICINFKKNDTDAEKWGCLNEKGDTIIEGKFLEPFTFYNGIAKVSVKEIIDEKTGETTGFYCKYIDKKGNEICDKLFESEYSYDMTADWTVTKSGVFHFILSKRGKLKEISVDYESVSNFSDGLACCKRINQYTAYIDSSGFSVYETSNQNYAGDFVNGFAEYSSVEGKYGFINKKGIPITMCIYEKTLPFGENMAAVKLYGKWGFIDNSGKIAIKPAYESANSFSENLALVKANGKFGFIDKTGKLVINTTYAEARDFAFSIAAVKDENDKWGFINKNGEWVIKSQFVEVGDFDKNGFSTVIYTDKNSYKNGKLEHTEKALISRNGKVVWQSGKKLIVE